MGVRDQEAGDGRNPPGLAASEEWIPCPKCGTHVKRKNLKRHVKHQHVKDKGSTNKQGERNEGGGGSRPGTKPGPRNPVLADRSNEEMASRVAVINRELKALVPAFHAEKMSELSREKRLLVRELKARKSSGLSRQWGRWYGGPGKVRHYRGRSG